MLGKLKSTSKSETKCKDLPGGHSLRRYMLAMICLCLHKGLHDGIFSANEMGLPAGFPDALIVRFQKEIRDTTELLLLVLTLT